MARQRARRRDVLDDQPPARDREVAGERARDAVAPRRRAAERQRRLELRDVGEHSGERAGSRPPLPNQRTTMIQRPAAPSAEAVGEAAGLSRRRGAGRSSSRPATGTRPRASRPRPPATPCLRPKQCLLERSGEWHVALSAECSSSGAPARTGRFRPLRTARNCTLRPGWLPSSVRARGVRRHGEGSLRPGLDPETEGRRGGAKLAARDLEVQRPGADAQRAAELHLGALVPAGGV